MLYNLPNGKTIDITFEQWLNLTDDDIQYLVAFGHGEDTNSIWRGSSLENMGSQRQDAIEYTEELDDGFPDGVSLLPEED